MSREPDDVVALIQELLQSAERNWPIQRDIERFAHFSGAASTPKVQYLQFSDTLLIWLSADPNAAKLFQTPGQLVRTISYAVSLTVARFIAAGIPLRGAVGFGPVYVSSDPICFTGKELNETFKLERQQEWAGVGLHDSAARVVNLEPIEPFLVEYQVPMSDSTVSGANLAIDWVSPLSGSAEMTPPWDQMFLPRDDKNQRKWEETRKFFNALRNFHRPFPIGLAVETITDIRTRLARLWERRTA